MTATEIFNVLLVDSEGPGCWISYSLQQRDGWDMACAEEESVHLMVQVMETWIVADASGVGSYYGPSLLEKALPRAQNLETVGKERIYKALEHATTKTQKGPYHKINHAAALLEALDPRVVRTRCPSCDRLFYAVACDQYAIRPELS